MVDPVSPVIPIIPLVIRPCPLLKMLRVNAQGVMAAMANHVMEAWHLLVQGAENESVSWVLLPMKANLSRCRRVGDDTALFCSSALTHQTAGKGFGFFGMVRQDVEPALFGGI